MADKRRSPTETDLPAGKVTHPLATDAIVRELTRERDQLRGILDAMKDSVYVVDPQHEVVFCNSATATEFGPVNGRKCYQYVHAQSEPCRWCQNDRVFAGETVRHEWATDKAGKTYEMVGTPVRTADGGLASLHILHDVTQTRNVEEQLRTSAGQLRTLSRGVLHAQEKERTSVSRELHDVLAQSLGTLKLRISLIRNRLHEGQQEAKADCDATLHYLDQSIEAVRRLSRELSPTILPDLGLGTALRRLVTQFSRHCQIQVVQRIEDIGRLSSVDAEYIVYRVFQEALSNVQKHACARNVSVILEMRDDGIHCLVEDDGVGFDRARMEEIPPAEQGLGLRVMAERIHTLGGAFDLQSAPGKGTCITVSIPLQVARNG